MNFLAKALSELRPNQPMIYNSGNPIIAENIIYESENTVRITQNELDAKIQELTAAEPMRLLRLERDRLITATDWWVLPDRNPTQAQLDYRQALRDITTQTPALDENGNLTGVTWPEKPAT